MREKGLQVTVIKPYTEDEKHVTYLAVPERPQAQSCVICSFEVDPKQHRTRDMKAKPLFQGRLYFFLVSCYVLSVREFA